MNEIKRLIFSIKSLKKNFGSVEALNIKKIDIHPGTIYALVGPPGSGKTTFLNILSGMEKPSSGQLLFENNPYKNSFFGKVIKPKDIFYNYGYDYSDSGLSVEKIISKLYGKKSNIIAKRHFNNSKYKKILQRSIKDLSPGEFHWVGMILALESDPRVLLIDQYGMYFTNEMEKNFFNHLKRMNQRLGTTIIVCCSNESLIKKLSSVIIYLDNGHISKIRSKSNRNNRKDRRKKKAYHHKRNYKKAEKTSNKN